MKRITFAQVADLAEYMISRVDDKEYIVATLFFNDAVELMRSLLLYDEVRIGTIEIADFEYDGYTDEYYVSLMDDYTLCVERALSDNKYVRTDAALLLLNGDVKYAIVDVNDESECIEIVIGEDDSEKRDCTECNCAECDCEEHDCEESDFVIKCDCTRCDDIDKIFDAIKFMYDFENLTGSFLLDREALYDILIK